MGGGCKTDVELCKYSQVHDVIQTPTAYPSNCQVTVTYLDKKIKGDEIESEYTCVCSLPNDVLQDAIQGNSPGKATVVCAEGNQGSPNQQNVQVTQGPPGGELESQLYWSVECPKPEFECQCTAYYTLAGNGSGEYSTESGTVLTSVASTPTEKVKIASELYQTENCKYLDILDLVYPTF